MPDGPDLKPITSKSLLIAEPESISPDPSPAIAPAPAEHATSFSSSPKQHCTSSSRRLLGRAPPNHGTTPSLQSISSISSAGSNVYQGTPGEGSWGHKDKHHLHVRHPDHASHIISQVAEWLQQEKAKRTAHRSLRQTGQAKLAQAADATKALAHQLHGDKLKHLSGRPRRSSSDLSDGNLALEKLERILSASMHNDGDGLKTPTEDKEGSYFPRRKSVRKNSKNLLKKKSTSAISDSDQPEGEILVPSAEVILDNSKTLGYSGGAANSELDLGSTTKRAAREKEAWQTFKSEIVRLTHTLKISGWRRVPIEQGGELDVERLSGALTNAVYVVSPPKGLPETPAVSTGTTTSLVPRKQTKKLLLRIYGPQVEHLIDRESELQILRRLGRKKIGPRLLGTFTNGRFEQFFHARTLTAKDLRIPDTSKQIAKRMRELHEGIELLEEERDGGAFIWRNWDKWVDRCEEVICWLDRQILENKQGPVRSRAEEWKKRGLICGVEWPIFRTTVNRYRKWLYDQHRGPAGIRQRLVFAHNDTQYGNLLRLEPSGESPLLLPENSHKQLVVIDFEYASANVPGLEFANHFTEWCYDYHDASKPYALRANRYPTVEEQHRFLKAYVQHHAPLPPSISASPVTSSTPGPTSSISSFVLDSRAPPAQYAEDEARREKLAENEIERLRHETRMWRVANSAQWVAWGIVQAKVPGMNEALEAKKSGTPTPTELSDLDSPPLHSSHAQLHSDPLSPEMKELALDAHNKRPVEEEGAQEDGEDEFDYLGYAQERAMFFWGDVLQLGITKEEDLPAELLGKVKVVAY